MIFIKIYIHYGGASRALVPTWLVVLENLGLKGGALRWRRASCPGKALAGAVEAAPARASPGEPVLPSCSLYFCLGIALTILRL